MSRGKINWEMVPVAERLYVVFTILFVILGGLIGWDINRRQHLSQQAKPPLVRPAAVPTSPHPGAEAP